VPLDVLGVNCFSATSCGGAREGRRETRIGSWYSRTWPASSHPNNKKPFIHSGTKDHFSAVPPGLRLHVSAARLSSAVTGVPGADYSIHQRSLSHEGPTGEFGFTGIPADTLEGLAPVPFSLAGQPTTPVMTISILSIIAYERLVRLIAHKVDPARFELAASSMPLRRAPSCAMGPFSRLAYRLRIVDSCAQC
jgi:hypothetical protein